MKAHCLLLFALIYGTGLLAQKKTYITVKAGNNIMDMLSSADMFFYPHFTDGTVFLRDGTAATGKLNYSRLVDEIHFINASGDTLALTNEKNIKYIVIASDTFYYDQGYVRLLSSGDLVKVGRKEVWIIADTRQVGAYNTTNNAVGITSYTSFNESGRLYDLIVNEDIILKKIEQYYLGDAYNHFVPASKKNVLLLLPKEQRRIEMYLRENKTNFNQKEDIEKLIQYLEHP
jgi:hypothetical protein